MNLGERGYLQEGRGNLVIECITGTKHTRNDLTHSYITLVASCYYFKNSTSTAQGSSRAVC